MKKFNLAGIAIERGETVYFGAYKETPKKLKNKRTSHRWDVLKVHKKSITLMCWPTCEIITLSIKKAK